MKKLSLLLAISLWLTQLSFAQVKRQYQDENFSETTVVVKTEGVSDQEILSANFDMDYVSMGTVIRITTEADVPEQSIPEQPKAEIIKLAQESIPESPVQVQEQIKEEAPIVAAAGNAEIPQEVIPAAAKTTSKTSSFSGSRKGGNYPVYSGFKGLGKQKRVKKNKRKKKNKKKCFKF